MTTLPSERPGPPGGTRDRNRKERRAALEAAALALMLERGIESVSIDDITTKAEMAKANFYRYFESKKALVTTVVEPLLAELREASEAAESGIEKARSPQDLLQVYQVLALRLGAALFAHPLVVRLYLQEARLPDGEARAPIGELQRTVAELSIRLSIVAREHGLLNVRDPRISALTVLGAIERLLWATFRGEIVDSPPEIANQLIEIILEGVRARA